MELVVPMLLKPLPSPVMSPAVSVEACKTGIVTPFACVIELTDIVPDDMEFVLTLLYVGSDILMLIQKGISTYNPRGYPL